MMKIMETNPYNEQVLSKCRIAGYNPIEKYDSLSEPRDTHPDVVEWVWYKFTNTRKDLKKILVFGLCALCDSDNKIVVIGMGTNYYIRVREEYHLDAETKEYIKNDKYLYFGTEWFEGKFSEAELDWI